MSQHIVCGIDVGNYSVKTVIAEASRDPALPPRIIGVGSAPSTGLRRGMVIDLEEAIEGVRTSVNAAQAMAGVKVKDSYVAINGLHIRTQLSRGVIAVARADGEISPSDVNRLIEAASTVSLPPNYEIIHIIPRTFTIDGHEQVKNAIGMKGVRLEAEVLLIEGLSPYIRNLAKCVSANDIEVAEFVFAPLAASKAVLNKYQREYGVMLLDFGGGVSSMALFHEGDLIHTAVLPIGSRHVTNDLAIAFRTSVENAETIKNEYGFVGAKERSDKRDSVDLSTVLGETDYSVPRRDIARIIDARLNELFDIVSTEMKKPQASYMLPAGLVLAGGGSKLAGMINYSKNRLGLTVKLASESPVESISEVVHDPTYAVAIGLVMWGMENEQMIVRPSFMSNFGGGAFRKIVGWMKDFIP